MTPSEQIWTDSKLASLSGKTCTPGASRHYKSGVRDGWLWAIEAYEQHIAATPTPTPGAPPSESLIEHLELLMSDWENAKYEDEAATFASGVCASDLQRALDAYRGEIVVSEGHLLTELLESWRVYVSYQVDDSVEDAYLTCIKELEDIVATFPKRSDAPAAGPTSEGPQSPDKKEIGEVVSSQATGWRNMMCVRPQNGQECLIKFNGIRDLGHFVQHPEGWEFVDKRNVIIASNLTTWGAVFLWFPCDALADEFTDPFLDAPAALSEAESTEQPQQPNTAPCGHDVATLYWSSDHQAFVCNHCKAVFWITRQPQQTESEEEGVD